MSEVNVQIQNPQQTVNINNPSITIEIAEDSIEVEISEGQPLQIQVQNPVIEVNIGGPCDCGDSGGHEIQDEGTPLTQRGGLNFVGAGVTVTDDSGNDRTTVTISGGGGGGTWGSITGTLSDQTDLQTALDGKVDENAAITGATKTKITYDAKGLVTAGADATTADINDSTDRRYVTDAQQTVIGNTSGTNTGDQTITLTGDVTGSGTGGFAATIAADAVTNTKAANMAAWTVKGRNNAASGDPQDIGVADLAEEGSPAAGDMLFGWESGGTLRKFDIGNLPGGGGGASYESITSGELQTLIDADGLTPGGWYLITDASGTDLGFLTYAVTENQISVAGVGGYLNADFQDFGNYDGVEAITGIAAGTRHGIWRTSFEALTINYTNLSGGVFAVGDTITGGTTGATAVILTDDGVSSMTAYMASAGVAFDGSEVLDNGSGVTADQDGVATGPTIQAGDIVIWNILHWQLTDDTVLDGTDPATNTAAYTQLLKTDAGQGYITAWDVIEFDFTNNNVVYRQDSRGGLVRGATGVEGYQFGRDDCAGNNIQSPDTFDIRNLVASFNNNTTFPGAIVSEIVTGADTAIENNILENGAQLSGITAGANCSISRNKIGQGATLGGSTTMGNGARIDDNTLSSSAFIMNIDLSGSEAAIYNNVLSNFAGFANINMGDFCEMSNNVLLNAASFGLLDLVNEGSVSGCFLHPDASIQNIEADGTDGGPITGWEVGQGFTVSVLSQTFVSGNGRNKVAKRGYSNFAADIDIDSLTILDCLAENNYVGIFNLTSSNATEAIDTITNPPTAFPFTLRPAAGLALTITGTAYAGIAAGQIALKAASYVLDGDKGEYIVLEIDPLGSGALIEKFVVNGLI